MTRKENKKIFFRNLFLIFMVTSTVSSFICAYLYDFHPTYKGFIILFKAKAIIGTFMSGIFGLCWHENRDNS